MGSSALVALERAAVDLDSRAVELGGEPAVTPAIVYAELQVGVRLARDPASAARRQEWIQMLISRAPIVEFDRLFADRWADVFALLTKSGTMIPANDLQVAATALHLDYTVLLGPKGDAHFENVPGLRVARVEL